MNKAIIFDTETTGLPVWKEPSESEAQPHIVQLAAHQVDLDAQKVIQTIDVIVKPEGWVSSPEALETHGITEEYAGDVGIPEKLAVEMLMDLCGNGLHIAHNTTFDRRILRIALKRYFGDRIADDFKDAPYECTGLLSKPIMKMEPKGRYGYKMPKLEEAYRYFTDKELENAHTAIADVNACMEIYWAIKKIEMATALDPAVGQ
ncbi:3'-5' exonuclease [Gilvimarinus chinensis]|uniref:3'-5' exonuclease n=1 Tax=Gilvimarinus chinensis TaxID=396005 RepID=UPI0003760853|nr:3'-5' exonuclease [Gilvimarinus chinensis]